MIAADGSGLRALEFAVPGQVLWQPGPFFADGNRMIFLSMEPRRDGEGRSFDEYYTQTPTHVWVYDLARDRLTEIATRERQAVFYTPALLLSDERILMQVVKDRVGRIVSMNLDGTDARDFTRAGEGLPYGLSLSPDRRRVAFHLATSEGYQVWTANADGGNRVRVAAHPDHLYFGTSWSPDGRWILYQDCHFKADPAHDWSDLCIGRADGTEHRVLTHGQAHWFGAAYGPPAHRGNGSNFPVWTPAGKILYARRLPGAKVPWEFQPQRPDVDHFNRDWKPELARGGTVLCELDPASGQERALTTATPPHWDFRPTVDATGGLVAFCRCATGTVPALWVLEPDAVRPRFLTAGLDGNGADQPRWLPAG